MQDPVAARLACHVIAMHAGLVAWIAEAEMSRVLPHLGLDGSVTESREPDDGLFAKVSQRLDEGQWNSGRFDPERLDPVRQRLAHRLGELAAWYGEGTGMGVEVEEWEPLAVRLGDLIGDQIAANALAMCLVRHRMIAQAAWIPTGEAHRKRARERWRRLAAWYIKVLDQQPTKGTTMYTGKVVIQSVEGEGERRFG
jgi:hypothetical protein